MILNKTGAFTLYQLPTDLEFQRLEREGLLFQSIDNTTDVRSVGFVCFDDEMHSLGHTPVQKGQYLAATVRIDTRKVPGPVLKKYIKAALEKEKQDMGASGKKFITKERKAEIKDQVSLMLLSKALPVPALIDVVIDTMTGRVYVGTTSAKGLEFVEDLLFATFNTAAMPLDVNRILGEEDLSTPFGSYFLTWATVKAMQSERDWFQIGSKVALRGNSTATTTTDEAMVFSEAKKALSLGCLVSRASFDIYNGEFVYRVAVDKDYHMTINTPFAKAVVLEGEEPDTAFYDKMGHLDVVVTLFEGLVKEFAEDMKMNGIDAVLAEAIAWGSQEDGE